MVVSWCSGSSLNVLRWRARVATRPVLSHSSCVPRTASRRSRLRHAVALSRNKQTGSVDAQLEKPQSLRMATSRSFRLVPAVAERKLLVWSSVTTPVGRIHPHTDPPSCRVPPRQRKCISSRAHRVEGPTGSDQVSLGVSLLRVSKPPIRIINRECVDQFLAVRFVFSRGMSVPARRRTPFPEALRAPRAIPNDHTESKPSKPEQATETRCGGGGDR